MATAAPDYYKLLGVRRDASIEQIKAAYKRRALRFHPDKNSSVQATEQFKLCSEAFGVLSDPARRAEYDDSQLPRTVPELAREVIGDILGGRFRRVKRDGEDLQVEVHISLAEATNGCSRRIEFSSEDSCLTCGGSGAAAGAKASCPQCNGKGEIRDGAGLLALHRRCTRCGGNGVVALKPCSACSGVGSVERDRVYTVSFPPGTQDGDIRLLDGEGESGVQGGRNGDLHIVARVEPHRLLKQEGKNLSLELPIRVSTAALGGQVRVPVLSGSVSMRIPPGTQSGTTFRLKGMGLPDRGGERRGDQLITVVIETPVALDEEAQKALQEWDRNCEGANYPRAHQIEMDHEDDD